MALLSQLFRGDAKLEAAAQSDPAHITMGARGPHVSKIQQALNVLDQAAILVDESYGPQTAGAVLAFKKRRGIIPAASGDNIVGKKTMAALDAEMVQRERGQPNPLPPLPPPTPPDPVPPMGVSFGIRCDGEVEGEVVQSTDPPGFFQIADFVNRRAAHSAFIVPGALNFGGIFSFERALRPFNTNQFFQLEGLGLPAEYFTTIAFDEDGRETLASSLAIDFTPNASVFPTRIQMGVHASLNVSPQRFPSTTTISRRGRLKFLKLLPFPPPRFVPR